MTTRDDDDEAVAAAAGLVRARLEGATCSLCTALDDAHAIVSFTPTLWRPSTRSSCASNHAMSSELRDPRMASEIDVALAQSRCGARALGLLQRQRR